jgi:hypothetical protein
MKEIIAIAFLLAIVLLSQMLKHHLLHGGAQNV